METELPDILEVYTIYDHPTDYPQDIVVKKWMVFKNIPEPVQDEKFRALFQELDNARDFLKAMNLTCIPRSAEDDFKIVESWI